MVSNGQSDFLEASMGFLKRAGIVLTLLSFWLISAPARAQSPNDASIPPELRPWVPWVLEAVPERDCRTIDGEVVCVWLGSLRLDVGPKGGSFELAAFLDKEDVIPLPGAVGQWPEEVKIDGRPAAVLAFEEKPVVRAGKGAHALRGVFRWSELPESLAVPSQIARVALAVDGKDVPQSKRTAGEPLWLASGTETTTEAEALGIDVARRIDDGVPLSMTTRITLRVSGKAREVDLGKVLVAGTQAQKLESVLPARLGADGALHVKLRSGTYTVQIDSRSERSLERLAPPVLGAPWPTEEVWVFGARAALRDVDLRGAPSIDPGRTRLDEDWKKLPAYLVGPGNALELVTTRRGEAEPPPNRIELSRKLWLDLDGSGFSVRDEFSGNLERGFRLDRASGELGRATVGGVDQLVTLGKGGRRGVELRERRLSVVAESRESGTRDFLAVGWNEGVERLRAELTLPPGYELFATRGVDTASGTWVSSFDLFELLFIVVVVAAFSKLSGVRWGALLLLLLVLSHGEDGAPYAIWIVLFALTALLRVLRPGRTERLVRFAWVGCAVVFGVVAVTFVVSQVHRVAYPSRAAPSFDFGGGLFGSAALSYRSDRAFSQEAAVSGQLLSTTDQKEGGTGAAAKSAPASDAPMEELGGETTPASPKPTRDSGLTRGKKADLTRQDPNAVIQTGPGLPKWGSRTWALEWSGPVDRDQRVKLYLVTPTMGRLLAAARVILLALLGLLVLRAAPRGRSLPKAAPAAAALFLGVFGLAAPAHAETPSRELLDELKQRLVPAPACGTECVSVTSASVAVEGRRLVIESEVHAGAPASLELPGPASSWVFDAVTVDGAPSVAIVLASDGFFHLRLDAGIHRVRVEGRLTQDELDLALGDKPRRVSLSAAGWDVQGVREDGQTDGALHFSRRAEQGQPSDATAEGSALSPWFEVERRFEIGVLWTIHSTLRRVSPPGSPVVLRYPLLAGETVTSSEHAVDKGHLVVSLERDDTTSEWESTLTPRDALRLVAPERVPWTEVWVLDCSVVWHCAPSDLPPVARMDAEGRYQPLFRPWPGEALELGFVRPAAARGTSLTIDNVTVSLKPGPRLLDASLHLEIRNSAGGTQKIELPPGAKPKRLRVNGEERATHLEGRNLLVALRPGSEIVDIEFQRPGGLETRFQVPAVGLGREFVNGDLSVELPSERWLLLAGGPAWGSVILFWGYLGVIAVVSFMLTRVRGNPLKPWQWLLLGLGLSQVPLLGAVAVAGWFFLTSFRAKYEPRSPWLHAGFQLLLVGATLAVAAIIVTAAYRGLVLPPDMMVIGGSERHLSWYVDRAGPTTPTAWIVSAPMFVFRGLMIAWSLWAAWSFVRWMRSAYAAFTTAPVFMPLWRTRTFAASAKDSVSEPADRIENVKSEG
jgi:hypothetical protein